MKKLLAVPLLLSLAAFASAASAEIAAPRAPGRVFQATLALLGHPVTHAETLVPALAKANDAAFVRALAKTLRIRPAQEASVAGIRTARPTSVDINPAFSGNLRELDQPLAGVPGLGDIFQTSRAPIAVYRRGKAQPVGAIMVDEIGIPWIKFEVRMRLFVAARGGFEKIHAPDAIAAK